MGESSPAPGLRSSADARNSGAANYGDGRARRCRRPYFPSTVRRLRGLAPRTELHANKGEGAMTLLRRLLPVAAMMWLLALTAPLGAGARRRQHRREADARDSAPYAVRVRLPRVLHKGS